MIRFLDDLLSQVAVACMAVVLAVAVGCSGPQYTEQNQKDDLQDERMSELRKSQLDEIDLRDDQYKLTHQRLLKLESDRTRVNLETRDKAIPPASPCENTGGERSLQDTGVDQVGDFAGTPRAGRDMTAENPYDADGNLTNP